MAITHIYDSIYSLRINISANQIGNKIFFVTNLPILKQKKIKAMSVSGQISAAGQSDQVFITLVDNNNKIKLFNYPACDIRDNSQPYHNFAPVAAYRYTRLFNLENIELQRSYFMVTDQTGPYQNLIWYINFYFED
jgi:hypothetical protein